MFTHPQFKKLKLFFKPITEQKLKNKLAKFFPNHYIVFTDLGRSAFQLTVKNLKLENSEILVPGYICDIFLPIFKHYNIKPIYLDIDLKTFNIGPENIEKNITPQTKSILVCHTYGLPVKMDKILEIAKKHDLKIIEDCAHIFPKKISGDCAFFSLSKIMPTINGGVLVCKKEFRSLLMSKLRSNRFKPSSLIKFARLFPFLTTLSERFRPNRNQGETKGSQREPRGISKGALRVFNWYLDNQDLQKRKQLAEYFHKKLKEKGFQVSPGTTYISALVPENIDRDELFNKLRKKGIFCSRIWRQPIYNPPTGGLPNTSIAASRIINFPFQNWFTKKDIDKIISCI